MLSTWSSVDRLGQAHRIADRLPDAEVVIFEESGHVPWIDEAEHFFATVGPWLARDR